MSETEQATADKAKRALLWIATIIAAAGMTLAGVSKFTAPQVWDGLFAEWGYPPFFKNLVGVLEVVGGLAVLVPRLATYAGTMIAVIMLGAMYTVVANQSDLGLVANTGNLVLFAIIAWARRNDRWTPGG